LGDRENRPMSRTAIKALSWIAVAVLVFVVIVLIGFGSGAWPFTELPPNSLFH
jgi:hypothetical protein